MIFKKAEIIETVKLIGANVILASGFVSYSTLTYGLQKYLLCIQFCNKDYFFNLI